MKKNILLIIGLLFLSSCAGKIQINQEFKGSGKGLFIVLSHIKQDKKDEFDNLLMEKIYPAMYSYRDSNDAINTANLKGQKSNRMLDLSIVMKTQHGLLSLWLILLYLNLQLE